MPDIEVTRNRDPTTFATPVNVSQVSGIDATGAADCSQILCNLLNNSPHTVFDFGGPDNTYLISSSNLTGCTLNTNGTVTVPSSANLGVGMAVYDITTPANLTTNGTSYATYVTAIVDSTHVTVSPAPLANASSQNLAFQFTTLRDGIQLVGHGALIYINYPQDGQLNGAHFFTRGGSVSAAGLKFLNYTPKTAFQRLLGSSNNGDLVRFGQQKNNGIWADRVDIDGCEFWGAYASGFEAIYANRVSVNGNSHVHATNGNGFGFTNILTDITIDNASVYNTGDDQIIVICDSAVPDGTQNVTIGDGVVLEHGSAKGIGIDGAKIVTIGSAKISDTGAQGIRVFTDSGAAPPEHVKIKHPILRAIGYHYGDSGSSFGSSALTAWAASTSYTVGQVRTYHGAIWQCITAHTSGTTFGSLLPGENANWNELMTYVHSSAQASVMPILVSANCANVEIDAPDIDKCIGIGINVAGAAASNEVTGASTLGTPLPPIQEIYADGTSWNFTFASAHGLVATNTFVLRGFIPSAYNGTLTVASAPTGTTLTVTNASLPGPVTTFGSGGTSVTTITLTGIPSGMPTTGSDHAVIYDPNAQKATVFTYTSITSNTLNGCFANSPSATLSFASSPNASYVNVPLYGLRIRNPKIKGCLGLGIQVAGSGSTTAGGQVDYLQAYDLAISGVDAKEIGGGITFGNATEVVVDSWKIRSYLYANSGTKRGISYSNVRNVVLGAGLITNDDGASTAIFSSGTNLNVTVSPLTPSPYSLGNVSTLATGTDPTSPASGSMDFYTKSLANRELPYWLSSLGNAAPFAQAQWGKTWVLISPQNTTSIRTAGMGGNASTTGTISHPGTATRGYFAQLASAASTSAIADVATTTLMFERGTVGDLFGGFFYHCRFYLPDASYNNTGASTGCRIFAGMTTTVGTLLGADNGGAVSYTGFMRRNVNGGATDTNWQFGNNDGGASSQNIVDTGLAFTAQHVYTVAVWCPLGSSSVYWQINDETAATSASGNTGANTHLPAVGTTLEGLFGLETVDAVARNIQFGHLYVESDTGA